MALPCDLCLPKCHWSFYLQIIDLKAFGPPHSSNASSSLLSSKNIQKHLIYFEKMQIVLFFYCVLLVFRNVIFECFNISLDVCKKCSVTRSWLFKKYTKAVVFLLFWNAIFEILNISVDVCKKCSWHGLGYSKSIQKQMVFWYSWIHEIKKTWFHTARVIRHRWRQTPGMKSELNCTFF